MKLNDPIHPVTMTKNTLQITSRHRIKSTDDYKITITSEQMVQMALEKPFNITKN